MFCFSDFYKYQMAHEKRVKVTLDRLDPKPELKMITVTNDTTVNKFRRECSKAFGHDIISVFNHFGEKVTDDTDFKTSEFFIASTDFTLFNMSLTKERPEERQAKSEDQKTTDCDEDFKNGACSDEKVVEVEFLSHSNSGKTSLVRSFVSSEGIEADENTMNEVKCTKSVVVGDSNASFCLTDYCEKGPYSICQRLMNKSIVIIVCSKSRMVAAIQNDSKEEFKRSIEWQLKQVERFSKVNCLKVLAVTKYDQQSECEEHVNQLIKEVEWMPVLKVSSRNSLFDSDVLDFFQFWNEVISLYESNITQRKASVKKPKVRINSILSSSELNANTNIWGSSFRKVLWCF